MQNVFVIAFLALCTACKESSVKEPPPPSKPTVIQTKVGPIEVHEGPVPPDAEFMCSADFQTHPMSELHVIGEQAPAHPVGVAIRQTRPSATAHWSTASACCGGTVRDHRRTTSIAGMGPSIARSSGAMGRPSPTNA
jgi:hypothetical protein